MIKNEQIKELQVGKLIKIGLFILALFFIFTTVGCVSNQSGPEPKREHQNDHLQSGNSNEIPWPNPPQTDRKLMRIAVVPIYNEQGVTLDSVTQIRYFREIAGYISTDLVRWGGYLVIDSFAKEASDKELQKMLQAGRDETVRGVLDMTKRYSVDAVFIIDIDVRFGANPEPDSYASREYVGYASVNLFGYDSGARNIGADMRKSSMVNGKNINLVRDNLIQQVSHNVSRELAARYQFIWQAVKQTDKLIELELIGATEYEPIQALGIILNHAAGVMEARQLSQQIDPTNPNNCFSNWQVTLENSTSIFDLQNNLMRMVDDVLNNRSHLDIGISVKRLRVLKGFTPLDQNSRRMRFKIDRDIMRNRE